MSDDKATAVVVQWGADAHDGPGWYYYDEEYPEEGSVGPFATREECVAHAETGDYAVRKETPDGVP